MSLDDYLEDHMLKADGYDDCILGIAERAGKLPVLAYSTDKIIDKLVQDDGMTREEAEEWFSYNIVDAWVGSGTPIFVRQIQFED
jgi:hypothetical protein